MTTITTLNRVPHHVTVKAPGLLPMLYKVSELAKELDLPESTMRSWLAAGAPHERDARGYYWVNGKEFANWVSSQKRPKQTRCLADDEAYCMRCKAVVQMESAQILPGKGKQRYIQGVCSVCGATLNRGGRVGQS